MNLNHGHVSVYIPKYERNFVKVCFLFAEKKAKRLGEKSRFSMFLLKALKNHSNGMNREDKDLFEECAYELAKKEKPKASQFVDRFIDKRK